MTAIAIGVMGDDDRHTVPAGHPERPQRLLAVQRGLRDGCGEQSQDLPPRLASIDDLARVHSRTYVDAIGHFCAAGGGELDPDTSAGTGSFDTARRAAGLGLAAIDALRDGLADSAFVAPRPPGHHATADRAMGFCLFNNVAVAAAALTATGERVAIFDWDVHHGNGTQAIFWDDPRVLYASLHQWPAYPGTGRATEIGGPAAAGLTINVPLPEGATGDIALTALDDIVEPAVDAFAPDWVLVSAGFDAHRDDPLAGLAWSTGDYARLTARVRNWVGGARLILFLEGGYDLDALRASVSATVSTLGGEAVASEAPTSGGPGRELVAYAKTVRHRAESESWF